MHGAQLRRWAALPVILMVTLPVLMSSWSCSDRGYSGSAVSITIGTTTSEVNSLIWIAEDEGYFARNGLNVTDKTYASGVAAANAMLDHEVDMVTGSEFAFVGKVMSGENIRTIGVINRSSVEYLVGRAGKGISNITDLKGKTIGVPLKSRPEFSLDRFLLLSGIDANDVTVINVPVDQSVDALASGRVDAVTAWQPYIDQIRHRVGNGLAVWNTQESQPSYNLVMCAGQWLTENPGPAERFLKSLIQAENYNLNHPKSAEAMIQKKLNYDDAYMASVWPDYRFSVSLDQSLIAAMEDEARWMISDNLTNEKQVPDLSSYAYVDGLEAVAPDAVNIIR